MKEKEADQLLRHLGGSYILDEKKSLNHKNFEKILESKQIGKISKAWRLLTPEEKKSIIGNLQTKFEDAVEQNKIKLLEKLWDISGDVVKGRESLLSCGHHEPFKLALHHKNLNIAVKLLNLAKEEGLLRGILAEIATMSLGGSKDYYMELKKDFPKKIPYIEDSFLIIAEADIINKVKSGQTTLEKSINSIPYISKYISPIKKIGLLDRLREDLSKTKITNTNDSSSEKAIEINFEDTRIKQETDLSNERPTSLRKRKEYDGKYDTQVYVSEQDALTTMEEAKREEFNKGKLEGKLEGEINTVKTLIKIGIKNEDIIKYVHFLKNEKINDNLTYISQHLDDSDSQICQNLIGLSNDNVDI